MSVRFLQAGLLSGAIVASGIILIHQWQTTLMLRNEVDRLHEESHEIARLHAEQQRLRTRQIAPEERARLQQDQAKLARLRQRIAELQRVPEKTPPASAQNTPPPIGSKLPVANWINAGKATPSGTLQTVLWSGTRGDLDLLASLLAFDPESQSLIDDTFARLPAEARRQHGSAEKVFATLLAARLPLDLASANVTNATERNPDAITLSVHLQNGEGKQRDVDFHFIRRADGWRLLVPRKVVENYQRMLTAPPTNPANK